MLAYSNQPHQNILVLGDTGGNIIIFKMTPPFMGSFGTPPTAATTNQGMVLDKCVCICTNMFVYSLKFQCVGVSKCTLDCIYHTARQSDIAGDDILVITG